MKRTVCIARCCFVVLVNARNYRLSLPLHDLKIALQQSSLALADLVVHHVHVHRCRALPPLQPPLSLSLTQFPSPHTLSFLFSYSSEFRSLRAYKESSIGRCSECDITLDRLNSLYHSSAAELAVIRNHLSPKQLIASEAELLKIKRGTRSKHQPAMTPSSYWLHPNKTRDSLSAMAVPVGLQFRRIKHVSNVPDFYTPLVGAWYWVADKSYENKAAGEIVITKVISKILTMYSGTTVCDSSHLFLDIGANSG
jgi:hypothetical protein